MFWLQRHTSVITAKHPCPHDLRRPFLFDLSAPVPSGYEPTGAAITSEGFKVDTYKLFSLEPVALACNNI